MNNELFIKKYKNLVDINKTIGETVIGLLMVRGPSALTSITEMKDEWFTSPEQQGLFKKIRQLCIDKKDNILGELVLSGEYAPRMTELMGHYSSPGSWDLESNIKSLKDSFKKVQFLNMVGSMIEISLDERKDTEQMISQAHTKLLELESNDKEDTDIKSAVEEFLAMQHAFEEHEGGQGFIGIPAGFTKLDSVIDGLRPGHFWVIGGYTSTGKTWFLLNILNNIIENNSVAFFSLEMSRVDIVSRFLAVQTGIGATKILRHEFSTPEMVGEFNKAKDRLLASNFRIYSKTIDLDELIMAMTREILRNGTKIFALDYIQLIKTKSKNEYEQISEASQRLQNFARENGVTILVLSQISNEHARDPNAEVMGFKGGGTLPASVDLAIELFNEDKKEERDQKVVDGQPFSVKVIIKKNRHGRTGQINMDFTPWNGRFEQSIFNDD